MSDKTSSLDTADILEVLPVEPEVLRVDGGATANGFLMQLQADLLGVHIEVAAERETTALGVAALAAGRASGVGVGAEYEPKRSRDEVETMRAGWRDALNRCRD